MSKANYAGRLGGPPRAFPKVRTAAIFAAGAIWKFPKGRVTFCSAWCVEEWRFAAIRAIFARRCLERDRGSLRRVRRRLPACGAATEATAWRGALESLARIGASRAGSRKSLWDADHIVPVVEGGGECDLENIRTLCLKCHRAATADLRKRRSRPLMQQRLQIAQNRLRHNVVALGRWDECRPAASGRGWSATPSSRNGIRVSLYFAARST